MMRTLTSLVAALLIAVLAGCGTQPGTTLQAAAGADATLVVRTGQALRLATGNAGKGTLTFGGWEYPFEISNMNLSGVGPGDIQLEGDVYNLNDANDFEGTYTVEAAEVKQGQGAWGFWLENEKGVRVHIRTEGQDVTVRLNTTGSVVKLL